MNTKSTGLLLAAAALLFALIYFVERPLRLAALIPPNHRVLPGLDPAKITALEVQIGGGVSIIRAEKTNQFWQLTKPDFYPADGGLIADFLQKLAQWDWQSSIDHPNAWEEYGLVRDQFTLLLQENGEERTLKIGRLSPVGDKIYLNVRGSDQILIANTNALGAIPTNRLQWRDATVLNLAGADFQKLKVHSTNWDFDLEWDAAGHLWKMTKPIEARADTPRIAQWLGQLQALRVRRFVPDDPQELARSGLSGPPPAGQLVLTFLRDSSDTNIALQLQAGASPAGQTNRAYARRLQPPGLIEIDQAPLLPWEGDYINFVDPHLLSLAPERIGSIEVSGAGLEPFTVQKTADGSWRVTSANGETLVAEELQMKVWLAALTNIQVHIGRSPVFSKVPYGLDKPVLRYQLSCAPAAGQTNPFLAQLLFGLGTNKPVQIFEMGNDEKYVNSIDADEFNRLPNAWWQLRDRAVWHFESNQVAAIEIHQLGAQLRYSRDEHNQWILQGPALMTIVQPAIEETLYQMGRLRANYWSGYGDDHLERFGFDGTDYRIAFEIEQGGHLQTNTIQFGKPSPHLHPYASVMRDGRRLIFEFPVDLYANYVTNYLGIPSAYHQRQ